MKYLLLIPALLFASCVTVPHNQTAQGILDTYKGQEYHHVILEMGPPQQIYSDGKDGRILHWQEVTSHTRPGLSYSTASGSASANVQDWDNVLWGEASYRGTSYTASIPPRTVYNTQFMQFYVDSDGIIYHHRTNMMSPAERKAERNNKQVVYWSKVAGFTVGISAVVLLAMSGSEGEY